ncbi:MAG: DUF1566 domain-containing protein [Alistipes sp.]|nr:DUF1566 domain-containing protein [Alistipes sp.]
MKKIVVLLLAAVMIMPLSCTESKPDSVPTPPIDNPDDGREDEPEVKTYKVGDYYKEGLAEGVVAFVDETGQHGLIISLDEGFEQWSTEYMGLIDHGYPISHDNGAYNTSVVKELEDWKELYPAFAWCDRKNALGLSSWFLPSIYELECAYIGLEAINTTLADMDKTTLATGPNDLYWTSVEVGVQSAYPFSFSYGEISSYDTDKKEEHRVRAMRKF